MSALKNTNSGLVIKVVLAIILIVIFLSFFKKISRYFSGIFGERPPVDYEDTPLPEGQLSVGFDSRPIVARLREVLMETQFFGDARCAAYQTLMELNDPEFVIVCNDYKNKFGSTLRSDMDNTWQSGCTIFWVQYDERVYKRMDELGVIG